MVRLDGMCGTYKSSHQQKWSCWWYWFDTH